MSFSRKFERLFHNLLPGPFALAVMLTFLVIGTALIFFKPDQADFSVHLVDVSTYWYAGIWDGPMLVFAVQMMLILILGHVLALSAPVDALIRKVTSHCTNTPKAAAIVCGFCIVMGLINWGLALIFGAIFARKVAENARRKGYSINYPLIAAAGYTGLMVWHGGLSGSSLIKVAEPGHLAELMSGTNTLNEIPAAIGFSETVFSPMNITVSIALLVLLPMGAFLIGKWKRVSQILPAIDESQHTVSAIQGFAEKLDHSKKPVFLLGLMLIVAIAVAAFTSIQSGSGHFMNPNFLNTAFLGIGLIAHGSLEKFAGAVEKAMPGAAGILIQFPLYFGILGVMKNAGMVSEISAFFVSISNAHTYPIFTFFSAGFVNILVPSGGGQWMVQGPIIVESAQNLGIPLGKSILSMAYGDQITNMLQPFWALPLLAITGLKARDILPYTLLFMCIGIVIYVGALLIF